MIIKAGTKVKFICDNELIGGRVDALYPDMDIAIVRTDEDMAFKKHIDELILDEDEPTEPAKPKKSEKLDLDKEITIKSNDFMELTARITAEMTKDTPLVAIALLLFSTKVHKALFYGDAGDDD